MLVNYIKDILVATKMMSMLIVACILLNCNIIAINRDSRGLLPKVKGAFVPLVGV